MKRHVSRLWMLALVLMKVTACGETTDLGGSPGDASGTAPAGSTDAGIDASRPDDMIDAGTGASTDAAAPLADGADDAGDDGSSPVLPLPDGGPKQRDAGLPSEDAGFIGDSGVIDDAGD